ncbi:MAG: glycosyltransferase family 2 protein [Flavobacteriales bacterium]|nr:glycosyltransferase family 2 protein [Flavobacteriales bacterium]
MMNTGPVHVRVVIPCRNEAGHIGRCLRSIVDADRSHMDLEVRVCDGMSTDGSRAEIAPFLAEHRWIKLVDNPQCTTPHALNLGLRPDGYEIGIILGAHAEVDPGFFREDLAMLGSHPEAGCVGGVIENVFRDATSRRIGAAMAHPFGVGNAHFRTGEREGEVDTVAFGAYRRDVFEQIGYFDERLARNQDDELNYRVVRAGWKILLSPRVRSRYHVRASYRRLYRQYAQYGYWKVYVNRLHHRITTVRQVVPALWVLFLVTSAGVALLHPLGARALLLGIAVYGIAALVSAWRAAPRSGDLAGVVLAFVTLHMAYGIGYLRGVLELVVLARDPGLAHQRSSR